MDVVTLGKAHSIFPSVCKGRWNGEGNVYTDRQRLAWQLAVVTELFVGGHRHNIMWNRV